MSWKLSRTVLRGAVGGNADCPLDPKEGKPPKQPYIFELSNGNSMAFAGLWDAWKDKDGHWLQSFAIVTTEANELLAWMHPRIPLLWVHVPRYVGMTLLVNGQIDPGLFLGFRANAAYGDLIAAVLALSCIFALRSNLRVATTLVWFTTRGVCGLAQRSPWSLAHLSVPNFNLVTLWYVFTFYIPMVLVSHLMIFIILLKTRSWKR